MIALTLLVWPVLLAWEEEGPGPEELGLGGGAIAGSPGPGGGGRGDHTGGPVEACTWG